MRVERSFLVRVIQVWEGDPPEDWDMEEINDYGLESDQDEHVCEMWRLVSDETELIDDDQWEARVITEAELNPPRRWLFGGNF